MICQGYVLKKLVWMCTQILHFIEYWTHLGNSNPTYTMWKERCQVTLSMLSVKTGIYKLIFAIKILDGFIISTPMNLNYKFILDLNIKILYLKCKLF